MVNNLKRLSSVKLIIVIGLASTVSFLNSCGPSVYYVKPPEWSRTQGKETVIAHYAPYYKGWKIFLDPGHGGSDGRNEGPQGEKEAAINLRLGLALRNYLEEAGATVYISRTKDTTVGLTERSQLANQSGAQIFISIHHNATGDTYTNHTSVWYHARPGDSAYHPSNQDIARYLERDLAYAMGNNGPLASFDGTLSDFRRFPGTGFAVLRNSAIPAVLIEGSFFSSHYEARRLEIEEFNKIEAWGIFKGLGRYLEAGIPKLTFLSPPIIDDILPTLRIKAEGKSGIDPASIEVRIDGKLLNAAFDTLSGMITCKPAQFLSRGQHIVDVLVRNRNGNASFPLREVISIRPHPPGKLAAEDSLWVEETLRTMDLAEKVGQMFIIPFTGVFANTRAEYIQELERQITENHVGGFRMYKGDPVEAALLINKLQSFASVPLLIASNFESGNDQLSQASSPVRVNGDNYLRVSSAVAFPSNLALGATNSEAYAFFQGAVTAIEARAVGIQWIFAPVLDVNTNPDNPIINVRSYGENAERVAALGTAFIKGAQANGVLATAKHFPGHGGTAVDSHIDLPVLNVDPSHLDSVDLVPFRKAVASHVGAVMVSHIALPKLEETQDVPATLSQAIVTDLLRKKLGFNGLIITDAMSMGAITHHFNTGEATVKAVGAGADCILTPQDNDAAIHALLEAVRSGAISEDRINTSVRRILRAKAFFGLNRERFSSAQHLDSLLADESYLTIAQEIADASITLLRNDRKTIPLTPDIAAKKRILSLTINGDSAPGVDATYRSELVKRVKNIQFASVSQDTPKSDLQRVLQGTKRADVILCPVFTRVVPYRGGVSLSPVQKRFMDALVQLRKPMIIISLGSPYLILQFPRVPTYLTSYGSAAPSQVAVVRSLFGEIDIKGKLPVSILPMFRMGDGITIGSAPSRRPIEVVFQPSHQTDTGREFNEALTCNAIVDAAMRLNKGGVKEYKVWSYDVQGLHHARAGSNTMLAHTVAVEGDKISGYAYEIKASNDLKPDVFIAVHNNGGTNRNACWGFVHEGDPFEGMNRDLAQALVDEICNSTGLENRGVHGDSEPNRNDYRCVSTGKLSFYSLDEHVNHVPYRVLLEIGDNQASFDFLTNPVNQKKIGEAIQKVVMGRFTHP